MVYEIFLETFLLEKRKATKFFYSFFFNISHKSGIKTFLE